ncbi:hypothetical protein TGRUB_225720 [Toxoplasma gondii RUB]|uniref:Uncharacterized protein n=1 Tax=Toxoplasma gondii RUB TaxID=935652 RepID=A0A086LW17_TOXGO|nr:hypothetical protein TGRUB_225720 [Toxoplasma gondii RUB]
MLPVASGGLPRHAKALRSHARRGFSERSMSTSCSGGKFVLSASPLSSVSASNASQSRSPAGVSLNHPFLSASLPCHSRSLSAASSASYPVSSGSSLSPLLSARSSLSRSEVTLRSASLSARSPSAGALGRESSFASSPSCTRRSVLPSLLAFSPHSRLSGPASLCRLSALACPVFSPAAVPSAASVLSDGLGPVRAAHKFAAPPCPNLLLLRKTIHQRLQPILFFLKNDVTMGNYVYDQHFKGVLCSPLFEGKSYKEIYAMVDRVLEDIGLSGRVKLYCEPPSLLHKMKYHVRKHWPLEK